jgi:hypothetical protein
VEHRPHLLERTARAPRQFRVADADKPLSHRAEDGLDDHVAAAIEHSADGSHGVIRPLADHRFRHRQARLLQDRRRVELVHRTLDGPRRVDDRNALILDPVQRVDTEDELLERPVRNNPGEYGVERKNVRTRTFRTRTPRTT